MMTLKNQFAQICFFFLLFTGFFSPVLAQEPEKLGLDPDKWAVELNKTNMDEEVNYLGSLIDQLVEVDSLRAIQFLDSLENSPKAKGHYFKTHFSKLEDLGEHPVPISRRRPMRRASARQPRVTCAPRRGGGLIATE